MIDQNKINVVVNQYDFTSFDRVISYEIITDNNCYLGFAGKIIDKFKII